MEKHKNINLPELKSREVEHNHAAHLAWRHPHYPTNSFWNATNGGCKECATKYGGRIRKHKVTPNIPRPQCAACHGENL